MTEPRPSPKAEPGSPGGRAGSALEEEWSGAGSPVEIDPEQRASIRILVVDDERTLRESCSSILEAGGFPVTVTGKGDEALKFLRQKKPDIVLVDLSRPEMSGMYRCNKTDPRREWIVSNAHFAENVDV